MLDELPLAARAEVMGKMAAELSKQANATVKAALLNTRDRQHCLEEDAAEMEKESQDVSEVFNSPPSLTSLHLRPFPFFHRHAPSRYFSFA